MKKVLTLALVVLMAASLMLGCAQQAAAPAEVAPAEGAAPEEAKAPTNNILDQKKIKIGILYFNWTSRNGVCVQKYCDYMATDLNIEFEYYTCGFDAESCVSGVENMITSGCDGVISLVTTGILQQVAACQEAGVAYAVNQGIPKDAELDTFKSYDCVASVVYTGKPADVGAIMADGAYDLGYKNIAVVHNPTGMLETQDQMVASFMERFTSDGGVIVAEAQDLFTTQPETTETLLMNYGDEIEAVWGVLDCVLPGIQASGKTVPVICHDLPLEDPVSYFENGSIGFALYDIPEKIGLNVVSIVNWLNGTKYADQPDYPALDSPYTQLRSAEDCRLAIQLSEGNDGYDPLFSTDELKSLILAYNPDATWADFMALGASTQVADLCARRGVEAAG